MMARRTASSGQHLHRCWSRAWCIVVLRILLLEWTLLIPTTAQSLVVSEANCSIASEAQNASVTLTWSLFAGTVDYTRISHCSEALVASASAPSDRLLILGGIAYESAQPVVDYPVLVFNIPINTFLAPQDQILSAVSAAYLSTGIESVFISPASRSDHASFNNQDGSVFFFGGQSRGFLNDTWRGCVDGSSTNMIWDELVTATDAVTIAATPVPRIGHSFTKVFENSTMIGAIVLGGLSEDYIELSGLHLALITKNTASSAACSNRGPTLTWRMLKAGPLTNNGTVPLARAYHAAMTSSKLFTATKLLCVIVHGGKSTQQGIIFNELWRLCPPIAVSSVPVERQNYTWELLTEIGTTPGARYGASISFVDEGKLAFAGGSYTFPSDFLSDTWELNVNATQWVRLYFAEDYTPPRRGHTLSFFSTSTRLFLFGGRDRYAVVQKRMQAAYYGAPFCTTGLKITFCSATSKYVCIACPAGSYLESGSRRCLLCPQGTFSSAGSAQCTNCPAGTFSSDVGKNSSLPCTACPAGTSSQAVGAVSSAACSACAAGTFAASSGSVSCSSCVAGTFSNVKATVCTLCPNGQWSSAGAGACANCTAGTYTPNTGSIACYSCPRGFFSNSGAVTCSACPTNTYSASIGASALSCQACPSVAFTTYSGQTQCQFCPVGSMWTGSTCQPCSKGYYASAVTNGACVACPTGSYAPDVGSHTCQNCPTGKFTSSMGSMSVDDCQLCPAGSLLNGAQCQQCGAGTHPEPSGFCSACIPGSYSSNGRISSVYDASLGCNSCPSMSYSAGIGATGCSVCGDGSFSMEAWRNCISCSTSVASLPGCVIGRNGLLCSGNGNCVYGGCACNILWVGSDCSVSANSSDSMTTTPTPAVLFFPAAPVQMVNASASSTITNIEVSLVRSGYLQSRLQASVTWGSNNFTASPLMLPVALDFQVGELMKNIYIPLAQLSPRTGCRYFTLSLTDVPGVSTSAVSSSSDSKLIVYVDDMNGGSSGIAGRTASSVYARQANGLSLAAVSLDRLVATQVTISPQTTIANSNLGIALSAQPLNLLVAMDFSATWMSKVVNLLPAVVAELQTVYQAVPAGVRMGLLNNTSTVFYSALVDFFNATQVLAASNTTSTPLDWTKVASGLVSGSASWPSKDRCHLLVVGGDSLIAASVPSILANALRSQNAFAITLSPTHGTFAGVNDVMTSVAFGASTLATIPSKLRQAFQQKDSNLPTSVNILADPAGLVTAAQATGFSSGAGSLPVIRVSMGFYPTLSQLQTIASTTVTVGVPGGSQISIQINEPGQACFQPTQQVSVDSLPLSGWADAWHLSTLSDVRRLWKPIAASSAFSTKLRKDTSLLRTWTSTVLSVADSASTSLGLTRTFPGSFFAEGLSLVTRGYWRYILPSGSEGTAKCNIQMTTIGTNTSLNQFNVVPFASSVLQGEWNYGYLQTVIPWELSNLTVVLACNTSSSEVSIEWAGLGLLPDPAFACKCPRGFYNDILSDTNSSSGSDGTCVRCAAGSYCAAGIKRQCPDGTFSFGKAASCETCRDGWICTGGLARLCDPGTYSTPTFTCGICPSGYACRNAKKIVCPVGMFSREGASDCQSCPPGTISRSEGSPTCELCPLGWTSNYQRNHCITCPPGEGTLYAGQHPCSSCIASSFPLRNQPEVCTA